MKLVTNVSFSTFAKYPNIRLGSYNELPKLKYHYQPFLSVVSVIEAGSRPAGGIKESDFGQAISLGGEQIGSDGELNTEKLSYIPTDYYENASKGKIRNDDILLCKDGALTGKVCQADITLLPNASVMANEHIYVIRANGRINQKVLYYLMRGKRFKNQVKDLAFHKKGQPGLNSQHLRALEIPEIPYEIQQLIVNDSIVRIEQQIHKLQKKIRAVTDIMDDVFSREFNFNMEAFEELKTHKMSNVTYSDLALANNPDLRFSAKFHREAGEYVMSQLFGVTDKRIKHYLSEPIVLGTSVSPSDYSDDGDYYYISMATIKGWEFSSENAQTVSKSYSDSKQLKSVRENDILLARSGEGTIGKVALIGDEDLQGVFADFTMRIRLKNYNQKFAYFYFRTAFFQYLVEIYKKGLGNNTNIFPIVIQEFPLPDLSLDEQQRIVDEIQAEIEKQNEIKTKIADLRAQIDQTIEDAISDQEGRR